MTRPRAVVVVTGSELVRGERSDLNGPFLAREALSLGFEPAQIVVVGDAEDELENALRGALVADLVVVSGGLGPTHDDRTVEVLARVTDRPLVLDDELLAQIETVARGHAERMRRPYADFVPGVRKQATRPRGRSQSAWRGRRRRSSSSRARARSSCCRGLPASCRRCGPARSTRSRCGASSRGRGRPDGGCSACSA